VDLTVHRTLEFAVGVMLFATSLIVSAVDSPDLGGAAAVACMALGAVLIGTALTADGTGQVGALGHEGVDRLLTFVLAVAALVLLVSGETLGAILCVAAAVAEAGLSLGTRYVIRPGR
jgi:hypothetical protein